MNSDQERKMRELAERLAAMAPDAPPFPEETTMTSPARQPRTLRPLTVFAGAALAVLLGLGIPLILMNSGPPPVVADTTTTTTTTPDETTSTTAPIDTTTTTVPGDPTTDVATVAYLYQEPEGSFLGNPALIPFDTVVAVEPGSDDLTALRETINLLGDSGLTIPDSFANAVPTGVEAIDVRRAEGADNALIIDMNEAFLDGAGGLLADFTMLNQLIYTATELEGIEEVQFIVNNQPVTAFGSEGLDLSSSVNRQSFQEYLALIYLTSTMTVSAGEPLVVAGMSNTFEASLSIQVLDDTGAVVHEDHGMATCGSGCWGEYEFTLDSSILEPGYAVRLLEFSAEDGSPINVITVPVLVDQVWDLLPQP